MTKKSSEQKYTDPDLRKEIKDEIKQSDKGGRPGQWSARKSQLLAREYERRGGGYIGEKDEGQRNLEKWTEEDWQTQKGEMRARSGDETARYLPKEAWKEMSDEEKRETERRKREGSKRGEQFVANTEEARRARRGSQAPPINDYDDLSIDEVEKKVSGLSKQEIQKPLAGTGLDGEVS
jgi:Family of unknown function (DUF5872)